MVIEYLVSVNKVDQSLWLYVVRQKSRDSITKKMMQFPFFLLKKKNFSTKFFFKCHTHFPIQALVDCCVLVQKRVFSFSRLMYISWSTENSLDTYVMYEDFESYIGSWDAKLQAQKLPTGRLLSADGSRASHTHTTEELGNKQSRWKSLSSNCIF